MHALRVCHISGAREWLCSVLRTPRASQAKSISVSQSARAGVVSLSGSRRAEGVISPVLELRVAGEGGLCVQAAPSVR